MHACSQEKAIFSKTNRQLLSSQNKSLEPAEQTFPTSAVIWHLVKDAIILQAYSATTVLCGCPIAVKDKYRLTTNTLQLTLKNNTVFGKTMTKKKPGQ